MHRERRHRKAIKRRKTSRRVPARRRAPAKVESRPPISDPYANNNGVIRDDFVDEAPPDPTSASAKSVAEWAPDPFALM